MDKPDLYSALIKLFFAAFAILFVVGLVSGGVERKDQVHATALRGISFTEHNKQPLLVYKCKGEILSAFDLNSQKVASNPVALIESQNLQTLFSLSSHRSALLAFVGGSSGAITLASLAKMPKGAERARSIFATVLGAASGYLLGYWVSTLSADSCNSDSAKALIATDDFWQRATNEILAVKLHEIGFRDNRFTNLASKDYKYLASFSLDPIVRCNSNISAALAKTVERISASEQITADDYLTIAQFERLRIRLAADENYRALKTAAEIPPSPNDREIWESTFSAIFHPFTTAPLPREKEASFKDFCTTITSIKL